MGCSSWRQRELARAATRLEHDEPFAQGDDDGIGPGSCAKLFNRPLHVPLDGSARKVENFADLGDRLSCRYPGEDFAFAVAELAGLPDLAAQPLNLSKRIKRHQVQGRLVTVRYLEVMSAHPDTADISGGAGDGDNKP